MAGAKAWKLTDSGAPKYTDDFDIVKRAVLQVTDIANNNNKYYDIELHQAKGKKSDAFRVFTHYGRTDDRETNPDAGAKEVPFRHPRRGRERVPEDLQEQDRRLEGLQ